MRTQYTLCYLLDSWHTCPFSKRMPWKYKWKAFEKRREKPSNWVKKQHTSYSWPWNYLTWKRNQEKQAPGNLISAIHESWPSVTFITCKKLKWRGLYIARNKNLKTYNQDGDAQSPLKVSWGNFAGFKWTWKWFFSIFWFKKMTFWMKIALFLKEIQHKMNKNWEKIPRKMFLTKVKPTVKEVNDTDFHEGP